MFVFRLRGCRDQGGLGMGGGGKRSVLSRALTFPHPPFTPSWASPETPLLTSLFAQLGLKHILVAHTFRTNIIPIYPSSPWCSFCAGSAACSPCLQSCRVLEPAWETWPWNTPSPGQPAGHREWGLEGAFSQAWMLREVSVCREEQWGVTGLALCSSLRSRRWFLNGVLALRQTRFAFTKNRGVGFLFFLYQSM